MITSQVVAAHRPPSPPPPAAAPDFRFCSGSGSALLPQLSTFLCCSSQNLHGASGGVATHSFPSSFCPSLLCACACSRPNGARCPPVYHLPPPPTSCLASHLPSPACACVCTHSQRFAAETAVVTCNRHPHRVWHRLFVYKGKHTSRCITLQYIKYTNTDYTVPTAPRRARCGCTCMHKQ